MKELFMTLEGQHSAVCRLCGVLCRGKARYGGHWYEIRAFRLRYDRRKRDYACDAELLDGRSRTVVIVPAEKLEG